MMFNKVHPYDPTSKKGLKIGDEGEINVAMHTHPVRDETEIGFPYTAFFTNDAGSNDMVVSTDTDFCIRAVNDYDIYIGSIHVLLADAGAAFDEFGNLPALTTGCSLSWSSGEFGEREILGEIKVNLDFYRLTEQEPIIIDLSGGGADAVSCFINFKDLFLLPFGIRLRRGTKEKLTFAIRDDLTGIATFNIRANGLEF